MCFGYVLTNIVVLRIHGFDLWVYKKLLDYLSQCLVPYYRSFLLFDDYLLWTCLEFRQFDSLLFGKSFQFMKYQGKYSVNVFLHWHHSRLSNHQRPPIPPLPIKIFPRHVPSKLPTTLPDIALISPVLCLNIWFRTSWTVFYQ